MATATARTGVSRDQRYTVVHRTAGRLRLRLDHTSARRATAFAAALALHPATTEVRWVPAARSMTLHHDPSVSADGILSSARQPRPAALLVEKRRGPGPRGQALVGLLPRYGVPALLAELAGTLLAPPAAEVLRRV